MTTAVDKNIKVFYIGRKAEKADNINKDRKTRLWKGFGSSLQIPESEALPLLNNPDVWTSDPEVVASLKDTRAADETRAERITEIDRLRKENDELKLELHQLRELKIPGTKTSEAQQDDTGDGTDHETVLKSVLLGMDPASDEDYSGPKEKRVPRLDKVEKLSGFNPNVEDVTRAFRELVGQGLIQGTTVKPKGKSKGKSELEEDDGE